MSPAASPTANRPRSPGASMASAEGSAGRPTPPPPASSSDDIIDGEGEGGCGDFGDKKHDGPPNSFLPPLSLFFPDPIDIPGLELPHMDFDTSSGPLRPSVAAAADIDGATTATSSGTSDDPPIPTPPSRGSSQRQVPNEPSASQPTEEYTVLPVDGTDEAKSSAAFLRILSLVPLRNVVRTSELEGLVIYWHVILTVDQALELLADPNIGAVMGHEGEPYDPTDC